MKKYLSILILLGLSMAEAASNAHGETSIKDLLYPVLNFSVFAGLIVWKARGPIGKAFDDNARKVSELFNVAEKKDREAEVKYAEYQKKIGEVESVCDKIIEAADEDGRAYAQVQEKETEEKIERYKKDAHQRVATEKDVAIREVNESLLNDVISKAKEKIEGSADQRQKVTSKLMSSI